MAAFGIGSNTFEFEDNFESTIKIKIVGVGGGGNNAVNHMVASEVGGVDFIVVNTDKQALINTKAPDRIPIGEKLTKGHGAGGNPEIGEKSAEEDKEAIENALKGADMVFITAGMGGGTGTGAAPVVAKIAKDLGILTVGIVTRPFAFEGAFKAEQANKGIDKLREHVDSLIVIPNERLKLATSEKLTLKNSFKFADDVLRHGVQSISDLVTGVGYMNLDFADVTTIMQDAGIAHMGVGDGAGKEKAKEAVTKAMSSALLESSVKGARRILVNLTISEDVMLDDVDVAMSEIRDVLHPEAHVIYGVAFGEDSMEDEMRITIIATGFDDANANEWTIPTIQERPRTSPTLNNTTVAHDSDKIIQPDSAAADRSEELSADDEFNSIMEILSPGNSRRNPYDNDSTDI